MATGKSNIIIIIVPDIASPFFSQFTSVATKILKKAGYATALVQTDNDAAEEESFFAGPFVDMADGIISVTDSLDDADVLRLIKPLRKKRKPVYFVDRHLPSYIADSAAHDTRSAIFSAAEMFFLEGHQRVGLILGAKGQSIVKDKVEGYKGAHQRWGYPIDEELIRYGNWTVETGRREAERLLCLSDPVTAIVAGNNNICQGVIEALEEMGKVTGKDVSLVGFEESPADKRLFDRAGVSTFQLDPSKMAVDACEYMLARLSENGTEAVSDYRASESPVPFVDRGSVTKRAKP